MANTRREFLQSSAVVAAGLIGGSKLLEAENRAQPGTAALSQTGPASAQAQPQIPAMKFGGVEISRLILGVNPLYGFAHYNNNFSKAMANWYTQDRVCEVLHRANSFGINAFNYVNIGRAPQDLACFQSQGGKMHLIIQVTAHDEPAALVKDLKPLALQRRGEEIDAAFRNRTMDSEREWCKKARDLGVLVGFGTHKPEVIELVEEQGWDIDFYAGCVYNRTRTVDEWKQVLNGQNPGNAGRNLPAERSGAHVQGHARDSQNLFRVQDPCRRPGCRQRRRGSLPDRIPEHQAERWRLRGRVSQSQRRVERER